MKKIKIARIVTVPFTFISLLGLLDFLDKDGRFEVHIISGKDPFLEVLKTRYPNLRFHYVNIPRKIELKNDVKALFDLRRIFAQEKFDIVHSHTPKAGILTAVAGLMSFVPVRLHTFTGQVWVAYTGFKRTFFKTLDNFISTLNTLNYVDSLSQRVYLLDNNVGSPGKLAVLHKGSLAGIDVHKFDPERTKSKAKALREKLFPGFQGKVILYLGRLNNDKGLLELGNAFFELKEEYALKFLIVGPEEKVSPELESLIQKLRNDPDTYFEGFVSNAEEYYGACDIFCLPSYREGCPASVLEASAMKKPVVASNIYGIADIVVDGKTAFLFEVKNKEDLKNKIEKLVCDESLSHEMGKAGREFVCKDFTVELLTQKMVAEYLRLHGNKK